MTVPTTTNVIVMPVPTSKQQYRAFIYPVAAWINRGQRDGTGNRIWHSNWGGNSPLRSMGFVATHLATADVDGDRRIDLLAISTKGGRFFLGSGPKSAFTDATKAWGLEGATASKAAFGDLFGKGRPSVLLDGTLWINEGAKFVHAKDALNSPPKEKLLAVALADMNDDGKPDALLLTETGRLHVYHNPGKADQAWGAQVPRELWKQKDAP
jgi:hypothetical protein